MSSKYPMTYARSQAPQKALNAFAGHRWHTTAEIAAHAHYEPTHILRVLKKLAADGVIETTGRTGRGFTVLWRIPEGRHCDYCNTTKPLDHFYKNYRSGGFYTRCAQARHDLYVAKTRSGLPVT